MIETSTEALRNHKHGFVVREGSRYVCVVHSALLGHDLCVSDQNVPRRVDQTVADDMNKELLGFW
jgi:hypothetical protein